MVVSDNGSSDKAVVMRVDGVNNNKQKTLFFVALLLGREWSADMEIDNGR